MDVVHDLFAHVDGRPIIRQGFLDGDYRSVNSGAVAPRGGKENALLTHNRRVD